MTQEMEPKFAAGLRTALVERVNSERSRRRSVLGRSPMRIAIAAVAVVAVMVAGGLFVRSQVAPSTVFASGANAVPGESLEDVVTYGDHLVTLTPVSVRELPREPEDAEAGVGLAVSEYQLQITSVLWSRDGAPAAPTAMTLHWGGVLYRDDKPSREFRIGPSVELELDRPYIAVITYFSDENEQQWAILTSTMLLGYQDGVIGRGATLEGEDGVFRPDSSHEGHQYAATAAVWGMTGAEAAALLATTRPDPAAEPYMDLPPRQRWEAVAADTEDE